jgi:hypothetical protein
MTVGTVFSVMVGFDEAVTISVVVPEIDPDTALIVVDPASTALANPPVAIVAIDVREEPQLTDVVRFCVELSEKVPVAVNCWVSPTAMLGPEGVTDMDTRVF